MSVIVSDQIEKTNVFLVFKDYYGGLDDTIQPQKRNFIFTTTKDERDYLNNVFNNKNEDVKFIAKDGHYELYFPYLNDNKIIVLYFSEYQRYGKFGS